MKRRKLSCLIGMVLLGLFSASVYSAVPIGYVDVLDGNSVRGWCKDLDCPSVALRIVVRCFPRGGTTPDELWRGIDYANVYRSDVGSHGFCFTGSDYVNLGEGEYDIIVYAIGRNSSGVEDEWVPLALSCVGSEKFDLRQTIKKDNFGPVSGGIHKYTILSQYLGIMWDEVGNYDMYQSAVRTSDNGTVYCYYTKMNTASDPGGETIYVRTSPNGITSWSAPIKAIDCGSFGSPDGVFIADGEVMAVPVGNDYRFWVHYTGSPDGTNNYVFQSTTVASQYHTLFKRGPYGNVVTAVPMLYPSLNCMTQPYGAGQPSMLDLPNGQKLMYFTDTTVNNPFIGAQVVRLPANLMTDWFHIPTSAYPGNTMSSPLQIENSAHWTYYPNLGTYACVKASDGVCRISASSDPYAGFSDFGEIIYDSPNPYRSYVAEGGLLRGLHGWITTSDNSTIVYYGAGENHDYSTTGCAATRFYLYKNW